MPGLAKVRVDRGDGHLFNMSLDDAQAYVAASPGAKIIGPRPTPVGAAEAQAPRDMVRAGYDNGDETAPAGGLDLHGMTVAQLKEHAANEGIDISGAERKDDIIERIEAAQGEPEAEPAADGSE